MRARVRFDRSIPQAMHASIHAFTDTGARTHVLRVQIRTGMLRDHKPVELEKGSRLTLTTDYAFEGDATKIACSYAHLPRDVKVGDIILMADGSITLRVLENSGATEVVTEVLNSAKLGERKNMNLPGVQVDIPVITEKDRIDLVEFGVKHEVDFVAASFVQSAADVKLIRDTLGSNKINIISKIENQAGLENFDEILVASDGIMIARGDLGMEIPMQKVFIAQKLMTHACNIQGKPVITATQMLESMVNNPRPTRAEATDVANAVLDGTDCVMLSGETANGSHPVAAVQAMTDICAEAESVLNNDAASEEIRTHVGDVSTHESLASSAVKTASAIGASVIVVLAASGTTASMIAKYRPEASIIVGVVPIVARDAVGFSQKSLKGTQIVRQLHSYRGLYPYVTDEALSNTEDLIKASMIYGVQNGLCKSGDRAVAVHRAENATVLVMKIITVP